jgi:flagellar biosynthesis/type III secretory pathway chaperone
MPDNASHADWDNELADLLDELSNVQTELLDVLEAKRDCMASNNLAQMTELHPRAEELCDRLKACHQRREVMLAAAGEQGLPSESLGELATKLADGPRETTTRRIQGASSKMRLLQHHSLTNWVLAQRSLLHLSQMLEIIATGGQLQPTYSRDESLGSPGALVDREV